MCYSFLIKLKSVTFIDNRAALLKAVMVKIIVDIQYFIYNIEFIHKRTIWQRIYNEKQGNKYNGIFPYYGTKTKQ